MTKENREAQYKHFRDLEQNYVPEPGRDHDLEKEDVLKANAKKVADAMLERNPELAELDKAVEAPKEEPSPEEPKPTKKKKGK